jgi:cell division protein FtsQ
MNKVFSHFLLGMIAVVVIGWLGWLEVKAQGADWLPVKYVRIEGAFQYLAKDSIKNALIEQVNKGLYNADMQQIQQSVKQLSWIEQVQVKRVWPDVIDIKIVEQTPVVRWSDEGLLNKQGDVFVPDKMDKFSHLPLIVGPDGNEKELLKTMSALEIALNKQKMALVEFHVNDRRAWKVRLQNNMELKLGRNEPLNKFKRFLKTLALLGEEQVSKVSVVDLRYPNGYAVTWKQDSEEIDWKKIAGMKKNKAN